MDGGYTKLHYACRLGQVEEVEELIRQNPHVYANAGAGSTPLHIAAELGHESVVRKLLQHGAAGDVFKGDLDGDTPFHLAARNDNSHLLSILWAAMPAQEYGVDLLNGKNLTPLHHAADKGRSEAVNFLLKLNAQKHCCDLLGAMPFYYAARNGHTHVMELLLDDVNVTNKDGLTALHYASWNGHNHTVKWLLDKGASVKSRDKLDNIPLHWAARNGSIDVLKILLERGSQVCATNKDGEFPLDLVDKVSLRSAILCISKALHAQKTHDTADLLATNGDSVTILHYVAAYGTSENIDCIAAKLASDHRGAEMSVLVNMRDRLGRNPMHWAAWKGNTEVLQTLGRFKVDRGGWPSTAADPRADVASPRADVANL